LIQRLVAFALLVPVLYFGWHWMFPSDEAQIQAMLERIADGIARGEGGDGGGAIAAVARVTALQEEFAPDAVVDAGAPFQRLTGRHTIVAAAARVSVAIPNLEVRFPDVAISVAEDRQTATAVVTAEARFNEAGRRVMDARELEMVFSRLDGRWVIAMVTLIQPLERIDR
jgi:hypothetical protein